MSSFDRSAWEARLVEFGMLPGAGRLVLAICRSAGEHADERARALGLSLRARTALESGKDDYLRQLLGSAGEADYARLLEEAAPILEAACRERKTKTRIRRSVESAAISRRPEKRIQKKKLRIEKEKRKSKLSVHRRFTLKNCV